MKDGKVVLQVKDEIWQSGDACCKFQKYAKEQEVKFQISNYTSQVWDTEPMGWYGKLKGTYLQIDVKTMLLYRLTCFFTPEIEFSISDSLSFLILQGGLSSEELQNTLKIPKNTFTRYKNIGSKTKQQNKTKVTLRL